MADPEQLRTTHSSMAEAGILIVDDDEHVRRALKRVLKRATMRVFEAPDARGGIAVLAHESVQVVVSDFRMPGMSGVDFLLLVKERWPRIQRVLLTGQADTNAIEEAVNRAEIFRFIWKPWDDRHLLLTVQSALDQHRLVEENGRLQSLVTLRNAELERMNRDLDDKLAARSAALVRAASEWRSCFDAIGDPLAIIRDGCEVVRANQAFARLAGVSASGLPGLRCDAHAFGELPCPGGSARPRGEAGESEGRRGEKNWLLRCFPFDAAAQVVVFKDVTREREVTRRLIQAEKMGAVGQLAGGVAHEINNPLGGILAFAQLMSREERSASDLESLNLIADAAIRAKRIVESLLRFSRRPRADERGAVDLAKVIEDALFLLQSKMKGGKIEVVRQLQPAVCVGNANLLSQVAVNLIVNALQAMGDRGRLGVRCGPGEPGKVELAVTDTGPGVPSELANRIFEPFFTTKPEGQGTGLGLSICYQIAEEHGGSIHLDPPPEGGACFVVELPAPSAAA